MADNVIADAGTGGATFAADDIGGVHYPRTKLTIGADGVTDGDVSAANPLPVNDAGGSLTVDNAQLSVVGGGVEATAMRVTIASDSTGVLSVDDNGSSLTVDNAGLTELAAAINASSQMDVNIAASVAIAVTQSGAWDEVGINDSGNSITVDNAQLSVVGSGTEAAAMRVTIATDSTGVLSVDDNGGALTVDGTVAVTNGGTFATQVDGAALTALQLIDNPVIVDDAAFTPATSSLMMAGFEADEGSTDSVDEGDAGAARITLDRKQIVTLYPHTAGGLSTFMASGSDGSSILVATAQAVKASAGQLYGYYAYNPEAAVTFVHFYNTAAASVTVGTTNPLFTFAIPAGSAANLMFAYGVLFSNAGWSVAATTTAGGNTAPATGVSLVVWYI